MIEFSDAFYEIGLSSMPVTAISKKNKPIRYRAIALSLQDHEDTV